MTKLERYAKRYLDKQPYRGINTGYGILWWGVEKGDRVKILSVPYKCPRTHRNKEATVINPYWSHINLELDSTYVESVYGTRVHDKTTATRIQLVRKWNESL